MNKQEKKKFYFEPIKYIFNLEVIFFLNSKWIINFISLCKGNIKFNFYHQTIFIKKFIKINKISKLTIKFKVINYLYIFLVLIILRKTEYETNIFERKNCHYKL